MNRISVAMLRAREQAKLLRGRTAATLETLAATAAEFAPFTMPERATDTVIVKVRHTQPAVRRISLALNAIERATTAAAAEAPPFLATLVANGYAERITSVFSSLPVEPAVRGALRAMTAAVREGPSLSAARGLMSIRVDPHVSGTQLAEHLNTLKDEIEYAYVPAIKYPAARGRVPAKPRRGPGALAAQPNDAMGARQWGHGAIRIREARARAGYDDAAGIVVAILDSGIDKTHPDLDAKIHSYVNFMTNEDDRDYSGHGTHVAGIIAAEMNNGIGIAGVCGARIMALKGLPKKGNRWNAEAYYRALAHPIDAGARVLNLSLGGGIDPGERDVITDLLAGGVTVVAAMGNEFEHGNATSYPAAYDGVIAVGASDEVDRRASFSCTGRHISLVAPGVNVLSTTPQYPSELAQQVSYDSWPGTSMATPHVAAAAALLLAKDPGLTPAQIRDRLTKSADKVPWQSARPDESYGYGRLNVEAALK